MLWIDVNLNYIFKIRELNHIRAKEMDTKFIIEDKKVAYEEIGIFLL